MPRRGGACGPAAVFACVFGLILALPAAHLFSNAFSVSPQLSSSWKGPLCPAAARDGAPQRPGCSRLLGSDGGRGLSASGRIPLRTKRVSAAPLKAEGDAGGGNGGPILLAERSVNRVTLIGRVGLEPEVRQLPSGDRMASFSLATSEQWRDKTTGEVRSRTEWHRVVVFDRGLVDLVEAYVHKGRRLYVDGSLQTRRWVASDGQERYTTEVLLSKYKGELVLLESPEERHAAAAAAAAGSRAAAADGQHSGAMPRAAPAAAAAAPPPAAAGPAQALRSSTAPAGAFGTSQPPWR
ncbi:Single-stranded DNA-binding protein, related [Eimeria tenella]|uniref:Single-stranded DNA-binding protein, related n=1 Tax=Eimeria tenella TaxID=5802 RepID=U6KT59_EIMTE|nr:Single-stranded DNA-binding protein, related [Eimeria tenella]CDJ41307.1 Single-stranded DNA-binding protein, related [Eimeria tenella]|eukprot:XP_013232057.1 Single-stranded DNA-binding protein, related [Eimeria tenella]